MNPPSNAFVSSARRTSWGSAAHLAPDLWRVRLENPLGSLQVNTYVHRSGAGVLAVIDPGWPWLLDRLEAALIDLELAPASGPRRGFGAVDLWLYTHSHVDHMGSAALLQARSEAEHVVWPWLEPELSAWHAFQDRVNDWLPWVERAVAEPFLSELKEGHRSGYRQITPSPPMREAFGERALENVRRVAMGEVFEAGDLCLQLVDARGHDPHHIALWEPERRWLFSGDVVLATPTPISRAMDDSLALYRESLARLEALGAALLLPGHGGHQTEHIARSFARSRGYLDFYRQGVLRALDAWHGAPVDLVTIALELTDERKPLSPDTRWWVHLGLVDSHLHALIDEGLVVKVDGPRFSR